MRALPLVIFIYSLVALNSCKKPGCSFSENDNSYTQTDVNATVIGAADPNDWTYDHNWNACENNLFNYTDTFNYEGLTATTVNSISGYPNPFQSTFNLAILDTGT